MRQKLIELLQTSPTDVMGNRGVGALADHLIANGVTIVENGENYVGKTVFALYDVSEWTQKSGKKKIRYTQIITYRHLRSAKKYSKIEVREKQCTKTDSYFIGKTVFWTREDAEKVVENCVTENTMNALKKMGEKVHREG
jgi:hypothetical protein